MGVTDKITVRIKIPQRYTVISKRELFDVYKPIHSESCFCYATNNELSGEELMHGFDIDDPILLDAIEKKPEAIWSVLSDAQIYLFTQALPEFDKECLVIVRSGYHPRADAYLVCENKCYFDHFVYHED